MIKKYYFINATEYEKQACLLLPFDLLKHNRKSIIYRKCAGTVLPSFSFFKLFPQYLFKFETKKDIL